MNRLDALYQYQSKTKYWAQEIFPGSKPFFDVTHFVMQKKALPAPFDNTDFWEIVAI